MELTIKPDEEGVLLVTCPARMEWQARTGLVQAVEAATNEDPRAVILDLIGVVFLSSAGLGAICNLWKHLQSLGAELVLSRPPATILRLLRTVELPKIIPTTATLEEARGLLAAAA